MTISDDARAGIAALTAGRLDEAETHLRRAELGLTGRGLLVQAAGMTLARAQLALLRGDADQAIALIDALPPAALVDPAVANQRGLLLSRLRPGAAPTPSTPFDPEGLRRRVEELIAASPDAEALENARLAAAALAPIQRLAEQAAGVQEAQAWFQAGDVDRAVAKLSELGQKATDPRERALYQLMLATGLERAGRRDQALLAARLAREEATRGREPQLYTHASVSLCRLHMARGEQIEAFLAATRAWKSLEALLGEGQGALFQSLLLGFQREWGPARWAEVLAEAERRGGR